jgi:hypothetical protein
MTLKDWLDCPAPSDLHYHFANLSDRKLHLLAAAFLRRVWDDLPSHQTRTAVEATEMFADGRITSDELARLRSTDTLETCEPLWLDPNSDFRDELVIGQGWECFCCEQRTKEYECRVTSTGTALDGVRLAVEAPAWTAVNAAFFARDLVAWAASPEERDAAVRTESLGQFDLFREIVGPPVNPHWPQWRTNTVRGVARAIYRDRAFHDLPILADALQDAGCDDDAVLQHCRGGGEHVRGCWVLDLAMGIS